MSGFDVIQKTIDDHNELMKFLAEKQEISHLTAVESYLPKVILLAAASDLEVRTQGLIIEFFERSTGSREFAVNFVKNKAVSRQFHTYFNWKDRSANPFFSLFGPGFKTKMTGALGIDTALKDAVNAFCEIGALRNELVHNSYASYTLNLTAMELFSLYEKAIYFVDKLPLMLYEEQDSQPEAAPDSIVEAAHEKR